MKTGKLIALAIIAAGLLAPTNALALGGPSGTHTTWEKQGQIGTLMLDPYGLSPLTAVIKDGGYELSDIKVTIVPKPGGQEISYKVSTQKAKLYGGIPVFGLYPSYKNTVKVSYTRHHFKEAKKISESYTVNTGGIALNPTGAKGVSPVPFGNIKVIKVDKKYADRLYLVNNIPGNQLGKSSQAVWNNPVGGALEWNSSSNAFIIDTKGEIRWYLNSDKLLNYHDMYNTGNQMGFKQNPDGALTWGFGQRYVKYDVLGRRIFNRRLPLDYNDYSHSMDVAQNGHYFLRVASSNVKRPDGKNVRTVRDVIAEVDKDGNVVDDFRLYEILDPYRSVIIKALDQGAVCLNIDDSQAGKTLSAKDLAKMEKSDEFGDIAGTGIGRNWAHVNSVDYDPTDDSIIISSRHQSAIIKIGRDKKVKWILGAHKGWPARYKNALLQPVDKNGKKIVCDRDYTVCPGYENEKGGFDWTWTQHTGFRIDSKSNKRYIYISAFDNGDARAARQPLYPTMKYSRAVIYKIDQKKHTVQQIWEYGKARGHEWFSPVTSLVQFQGDKNSMMVYSATAGMGYDLAAGKSIGKPSPEIDEFNYGSTTPSVQIRFSDSGLGYQAMPFRTNLLFK